MVIKAFVTNPTAAGRFLVAGSFTHWLAAHFSTSYVSKISLEEMCNICRRWGASRPRFMPNPAWELQIVKRPNKKVSSAAAVVRQYGHFRR
jgi:hypothetical protein